VPLAECLAPGRRARDCGNRTVARSAGRHLQVVPPQAIEPAHAVLQRISATWLGDKINWREALFRGAFSPPVPAQFPVAVVRCAGAPAAFANLWTTEQGRAVVGSHGFESDAPRLARMDICS